MLKIVVAYPIVLFSGLTEPHLVEKESHEAMFGAVRGLKVNKILNYGVGKARPKALLEKSSPNGRHVWVFPGRPACGRRVFHPWQRQTFCPPIGSFCQHVVRQKWVPRSAFGRHAGEENLSRRRRVSVEINELHHVPSITEIDERHPC
jgi:hypothetical protein